MDSHEDLGMLLYRRIHLHNYRGNGGSNGMEESAVNNGAKPSADYISVRYVGGFGLPSGAILWIHLGLCGKKAQRP